jgi:hypothetical protein
MMHPMNASFFDASQEGQPLVDASFLLDPGVDAS